MLTSRYKLHVFLNNWINWVGTHRYSLIVFLVAGAIASFTYTINNLGMNTSTRDMLSPELEWRKNDIKLDRLFPQYVNTILVVIEAGTPGQANDAANLLANRLNNNQNHFTSIYFPAGMDFFRKSSLLYLDINELQDLADNLAVIQPFLARLTEDQTLNGFFTMLLETTQARLDGEDIELESLFRSINETFIALEKNVNHRLSWRALMTDETIDRSIYREFILLQPVLGSGTAFPAEDAIELVRSIISNSNLASTNGVNIRLTGSVVLSQEELQSVSTGMGKSVIIAFILVTLLLIAGLRSLWLVFATLFTLVTGLIYTAAFATATVGELNLISVAFAILYIGLGVDFAIHYCLRYRELILAGKNKTESLRNTATSVGESLLLCALTTAIGFYAFIPTDYTGVSELGWIAGSGMIISFIITMTLLPALLYCLPFNFSGIRGGNSNLLAVFSELSSSRSREIKILTVLAIIISVSLIPGLRFDHNTLNLQSPDNPSVKTYQDLLNDKDASPWTGQLLVSDFDEAEQLVQMISELDTVDKVVWLEDFVPDFQAEKLAVISEMDLLLGITEFTSGPLEGEKLSGLDAIRKFNVSLGKANQSLNATSIENDLYNIIKGFLNTTTGLSPAEQQNRLDTLEKMLLGTFQGRLNELEDSLSAEMITIETIPPELKDRWVSNGIYRLEIYPEENLNDNTALRLFVESVQSIRPDLIGTPVINLEAGDAVVTAFKQAFSYAFLAIIALLVLLTDRKTDVIFILIPLILAVLFTAAISVLFSLPLNFANIIALPMLLGIGVDSAIHILHRIRTTPPKDGKVLVTSSARAVLVSALTTILSIGNLAFSEHLGTASMGKLLVIGISMTLICTLLVLPSLLSTKQLEINNDKKR